LPFQFFADVVGWGVNLGHVVGCKKELRVLKVGWVVGLAGNALRKIDE
jgi:hypothetical protein